MADKRLLLAFVMLFALNGVFATNYVEIKLLTNITYGGEVKDIALIGDNVYFGGTQDTLLVYDHDTGVDTGISRNMGADIQGITTDGTNLYVAVNTNQSIYKLNPTTLATISNTTSLGADSILLVYMGGYVYATSGTKIYKINPADMTHTNHDTSEGLTSLTTNGTHIFTTSYTGDEDLTAWDNTLTEVDSVDPALGDLYGVGAVGYGNNFTYYYSGSANNLIQYDSSLNERYRMNTTGRVERCTQTGNTSFIYCGFSNTKKLGMYETSTMALVNETGALTAFYDDVLKFTKTQILSGYNYSIIWVGGATQLLKYGVGPIEVTMYVTPTIVLPLNTTYYSNSHIMNFSLSTAWYDSATCYLNGTSLGVIQNATTYQTTIYGGHGMNLVNITCINDTTSNQATIWFRINDFLNTSIAHSTPVFETTNNTYGIGFNINTDLLNSNLTCKMDYNNTASVISLSSGTNVTGGYVTPLTIINNTSHPISYNCIIPYKNGTTGYNNFTTFTQNLYIYNNLTSTVASPTSALMGENVLFTASITNNTVPTLTKGLTFNGTAKTLNNSNMVLVAMPYITDEFNASLSYTSWINLSFRGLQRNATIDKTITVHKPGLVNCSSSGYTLIGTNLTGYNEINKTTALIFNGNVIFDYANELGIPSNKTYALNNASVYSFCLYPTDRSFNYNLTVDIKNNDGYSNRRYYRYNNVATNTTTDVHKLYLLTSGLSTDIKFKVVDNLALPYTKGLMTVAVLRQYTDPDSSGSYEYIAMGIADSVSGEVLIPVQYGSSVYYKIYIYQYGDLVYIDPTGFVIGSTTITKAISESTTLPYFEQYGKVSMATYFNNTDTNGTCWYFDITSGYGGALSSGYEITKETYVGSSTICNSGAESILLQYVCCLGNTTGNSYTAVVWINDKDGRRTLYTNTTTFETAVDYGKNGLFLMVIMVLTAIFMFSGAEMIGVSVIIVIIIGGMAGFISDQELIYIPIFLIGMAIAFIIRKANK